MMKLVFLLAGLGLTTAHAAAQTISPAVATAPAAAAAGLPCGNYSGFVASGSKPVAGANIGVQGTNLVLITNEEGFFTLPAQVIELPTLSVSAAGYSSQTLTMSACDPARIELQLLPNARIKRRGKRRGQLIVKPAAPVFAPPAPRAAE